MSKIFIYGDSHSNIYKKALQQEGATNECFAECVGAGRMIGDFIFTDTNGRKVVSPALTIKMQEASLYPYSRFEKFKDEAKILFLLGTGEGVRLSMNERWNSFWFQTQKDEKITHPKDAENIPYQVVYGFLEWRLKDFFEGIKILKNEGYNDISLLASPPPHMSNDRIIKLYSKKKQDEELNFTPAKEKMRMKVHKINEDLIENFCNENKIRFIKNSPRVLNKEGFLLEKFEGDGVHANIHYARTMINHLLKVA